MSKKYVAVAGVLAAAAGLLTVLTGAQAASAAPVGLTAASFQLRKTAYSNTISALDAVLPNVTVGQVLDDSNRPATLCGAHAPALITSFCWSSASGTDDENTTSWYPQGITTSADADISGSYQGRKAILTSWYWNGGSTPAAI
jgi:hypothetical protein